MEQTTMKDFKFILQDHLKEGMSLTAISKGSKLKYQASNINLKILNYTTIKAGIDNLSEKVKISIKETDETLELKFKIDTGLDFAPDFEETIILLRIEQSEFDMFTLEIEEMRERMGKLENENAVLKEELEKQPQLADAAAQRIVQQMHPEPLPKQIYYTYVANAVNINTNAYISICTLNVPKGKYLVNFSFFALGNGQDWLYLYKSINGAKSGVNSEAGWYNNTSQHGYPVPCSVAFEVNNATNIEMLGYYGQAYPWTATNSCLQATHIQ